LNNRNRVFLSDIIRIELGFQMNAPHRNSHTVWSKAWHAVRFVLFGLGGLLIVLWFWANLMGRMLSGPKYQQRFTSPYLSVPLMLIGALLMLFGAGELRRWRFVFVFLSIPASLSILVFLPESVWSKLPGDAKLVGILAFTATVGVSAALTNKLVRNHYENNARRGSRQN
jgi:hypothetical protein